MSKSKKRLVAWANEYKPRDREDSPLGSCYPSALLAKRSVCFGVVREAVRLVECAEDETVIDKAELQELRKVAKSNRKRK